MWVFPLSQEAVLIVVRLYGGLGNQLFQYAAGRLLASLRGTELVLDLAWYQDAAARVTVRSYELWRYPVAARAATKREALLCWLHNGRLDRKSVV